MIPRIGIRREDVNRRERHVPLIPGHVRELQERTGLDFLVAGHPGGRAIGVDLAGEVALRAAEVNR